jgi:hypothetical protein
MSGSRVTRVVSGNQDNKERVISSVGDHQTESGIVRYSSRSSKSGK